VLQKYQNIDTIRLESRKVGNGVDLMIIELRKKSQVTIPKELVNQLNLQEGDNLDISIKDGVIIIEPVAVYAKSYIQKLEDTVMRINEEPSKYNVGPFKSVEEVINYLEELDEDTDEKDNENK
jgi:AbrB family looped-hinge helix DNA binding protein